jgi:hypothetical protein
MFVSSKLKNNLSDWGKSNSFSVFFSFLGLGGAGRGLAGLDVWGLEKG